MLERKKALKLAKKLNQKVNRLRQGLYRLDCLNCLDNLVEKYNIKRSEIG